MALILADGFDTYAASADYVGSNRWDSDSGATYFGTGSPFNGKYIQFDDDSDEIVKQFSGGTIGSSTIRIAFWFRGAAGVFDTQIIRLTATSDGTLNWGIGINSNSQLYVTEFDDSSTTALRTAKKEVDDGNWHHVEVRFTSGDSTAGAIEMWIDGKKYISDTAMDTNVATTAADFQNFDTINIRGRNLVTNGCEIDDLIVWDDQGTTFTGQLGQHRIETVYPNGDSAVAFTRSGGTTKYENVDETTSDGDTSYVESSTTTHEDFYDFAAMTTSPTTIEGVIVSALIRNTDVGSKSMRLKSEQSASEGNGTTHAIDHTGYDLYQEFFHQDPNSAVAWTTGGFATAAFGVEVM